MIVALYARKSTDQAGAGDKSESVERQIAHARAYAVRKGWTVADAHVYADDGISGAEFGDRRPGLARLLNALRPRPPFQVLVMSEESRLGRESIEVAYALKAFVRAGVRVFLYLATRKCPRRSNGRTLRGIWKVVRDDLTEDRRGDSGGRWDSRGLPRASIYHILSSWRVHRTARGGFERGLDGFSPPSQRFCTSRSIS